MSITLDPQTEQRIQQETARGHFRDPADFLNHAIDSLVSDQTWSDEEKAELDASYDRGIAALARGEGVSSETLEAQYEQRRAARTR